MRSIPSLISDSSAFRPIQHPPTALHPHDGVDGDVSENDNEQEDEPDPVDIIHVEEDDGTDDLDARLTRLQFERQMTRLFSQSRKDKPKKTLFFILPNRKKETLHKFIIENVIPGSTIYTDEWKGYIALNDIGFVHKTICHKRRFSRFEFDGNEATRVTTNHIERLWVELRRTLKYMNMDDFMKYIWLEIYRPLYLFRRNHELNFLKVISDFVMKANDVFD